jgi:hypothetical protein
MRLDWKPLVGRLDVKFPANPCDLARERSLVSHVFYDGVGKYKVESVVGKRQPASIAQNQIPHSYVGLGVDI